MGKLSTSTTHEKSIKKLRAQIKQLEEQQLLVQEIPQLTNEFLTDLSHQFRAHINVIFGFSELMISDQETPVPAKHLSYLIEIHSTSLQLLQLINDMFDSQRIESITQTKEGLINISSGLPSSATDTLSEKTPQAMAARQDKVGLDTPLVLVVEDDVRMNKLICATLAENYRIVSAFDGLEGLNKAMTLRPDLIVSDVNMPRMDGVELVHKIRQHIELHSTPIFILTASADDVLCMQMLKDGAQDYLVKPFSIGVFKARVANLILAKKAEDELTLFVYHASHDLKSPLPAIEHLASWIAEDTGEQLPEQSKKHLNMLRARALRMGALLDGIVAYSQAGKSSIPIAKVDTKQLVQEIAQDLDAQKNFKIKLNDNLPIFKTRRLLLQQVFSILISNSIKHHHTGHGHIEIGVVETPHVYDFFVRDDGPGIDPAYHQKIFQIFQTLQPRDVLEGVGMGLGIAKKIVEGQGGKINLFSPQKNKGTTFRFTWPKT